MPSCNQGSIVKHVLLSGLFILLSMGGGSPSGAAENSAGLFPVDLPARQWIEFKAAGFSQPVAGMIFRTDFSPCCGVQLGGISTGCLDIDPIGTIGFCNIFNGYPRSPKLFDPLLGLSVGGKTYVLASEKVIKGGLLESCVEKGRDPYYPEREQNPNFWHRISPEIKNVSPARQINYWGHYPLVDIEYETEAPVTVGLRAWSPFIPGDLTASDTPAAVFEVRLRNPANTVQKGCLALNFNGPLIDAKRQNYHLRCPKGCTTHACPLKDVDVKQGAFIGPPPVFRRERLQGSFTGSTVSFAGAAYALGVMGSAENCRLGGALNESTWAAIAQSLPQLSDMNSGSSVAVDFVLAPGQTQTIRFLLAWFVPTWGECGVKWYRMHTLVYPYLQQVIDYMTAHHETLLSRILNWQQAIYSARQYPPWLKDSLVNCLGLITEDGYYAQPKDPLGPWCAPDGLFGMIECPRACPQIECIPCSWYGNIPLVYFFPKLARTTLRGYKQYFRADGAAPFCFSHQTDFQAFDKNFWPDNQIMLNGVCYVDMVYRMWQRTGDPNLLAEFYDSVKKSTTLTATMGEPPFQVVGFPPGENQTEWWEGWPWTGIATHAAGMHLSNIMLAESMAQAMGDKDFARQCRDWFTQGSADLENNNWENGSYFLFHKPQTGKKSDKVMSNQLDAEWANAYLGLPSGVFKPERVKETLQTIKRTCLNELVGAVSFASRDGAQELTTYGIFPPETLILGMTYMYQGDMDTGMQICFRAMDNMVRRQGKGWDMTNMVNAYTGEVRFGTDYYQMMMLWAIPAAIDRQSIKQFNAPGGMVDTILKAGANP